jgi:hypothetical protein
MSDRVWTLKQLNDVHTLPKGKAGGIRNEPPWFWRIDPTGPVAFAVMPVDDWEVWVDARGHLCSSNGDPPEAVALAVILASKGMDSLAAMAATLVAASQDLELEALTHDSHGDREAACARSGEALGCRVSAAMLNRGRVQP